MKKKVLYIVNPISGTQRKKNIPNLVAEYTDHARFDVEVVATQYAGHATEIAKSAAAAGTDIVVAVGGDGTVNETVNGIVKGGGTATFGFVPVGTVNDLARALNVPLSPLRAIHMLADAEVISVDVGRCNDSYFCNNIIKFFFIRILIVQCFF